MPTVIIGALIHRPEWDEAGLLWTGAIPVCVACGDDVSNTRVADLDSRWHNDHRVRCMTCGAMYPVQED